MNKEHEYDCAIIGGGMAGLAAAIQLAKSNLKVILIEKNTYPFHRVCGEYISLESWDFLQQCGVNLAGLSLPIIKKLKVTSPNGNVISHTLSLGGFGISRYLLDDLLKQSAIMHGVRVVENTRVEHVLWLHDCFALETETEKYHTKVCIGSFGKRSNLDVKWRRSFTLATKKSKNYVGVKYHIKTDFPNDLIELHNFENGYCGISKVENNVCCLCYITDAVNVQKAGSIKAMENAILMQNPYLKSYFEKATFLWNDPVTISQISFLPKNAVENHVLMVGDAAGMIAPLCGNGMSMALHGAKIASELVIEFIYGKISRSDMEQKYTKRWKKAFSTRVSAGKIIQETFGKKWTTNVVISLLKPFPLIVSSLEKLTHGKNF